jgi:hypothetical protein
MEVKEIGTAQAILSGVATKVDGSVSVKLDILPTDQKLISNLLHLWASSDRSLTVAFIKADHG